MNVFESKVSEIIPRVRQVKSFRFELRQEVNFKPGQFFLLTIKLNGREASKHFSFSNSPTEKGYLEFTKRITRSEYSQALDKLKVGDWARLKMPLGSFTFEGEYKKIALLSGGIGITPLRSICKFACDRGLSTGIVLLYGNNTEQDIIFKDDFERMAEINKNLRLIYTLTAAEIDKNTWSGRTGYIDARMIEEEIPDYRQRVFYLCGPPKMVKNLTDILSNELKVASGQLKSENFSGYNSLIS